jgi:hypothetical protein
VAVPGLQNLLVPPAALTMATMFSKGVPTVHRGQRKLTYS